MEGENSQNTIYITVDRQGRSRMSYRLVHSTTTMHLQPQNGPHTLCGGTCRPGTSAVLCSVKVQIASVIRVKDVFSRRTEGR